MLHLRDGARVTGRLTLCDEEQCVISSKRVPIAQIAFIELREGTRVPPNAPPRAVILNDGTVAKGRYVSLNLGVVDTDAGEVDRDDVALIMLAPTVIPPPPVTAPPKKPEPPSGGTKGALWTGTIRARIWGDVNGIFSEVKVTVAARLREYNYPLRDIGGGGVIGMFTKLWSENSMLTNTFQCHGSGISGSGEGSTSVTTGPSSSQPSAMYLKTKEGSIGFPLPVGKTLYFAGVPEHSVTYDVTYVSNGVTSVDKTHYQSPIIGRAVNNPIGPLVDPNVRYLENGRMIGSYTAPAVGAFQHISVSWVLCREGASCTEPPPPGESGNP